MPTPAPTTSRTTLSSRRLSAMSATRVLGTLNSTPNTTFTLDFYANDPDKGNAGAYGPGQYYLGSATVTTDGSGNVSFNISGLAATTPGEWISATATDPGGSTSEFSLDIPATVPSSIVLTTSTDTQTYGAAVVTATVAGLDPAVGTPTGKVQLFVDGAAVGSPAQLSGGTAVISVGSAAVGVHILTAMYLGDSLFAQSASESVATQITPAPLTIRTGDFYKFFGGMFTFTGTEFPAEPGLFNNDQVSSITLTSAGAAPTAPVAGSPYAVVASRGDRHRPFQLRYHLRRRVADRLSQRDLPDIVGQHEYAASRPAGCAHRDCLGDRAERRLRHRRRYILRRKLRARHGMPLGFGRLGQRGAYHSFAGCGNPRRDGRL